jgi:hypothetical protein
VWSRLNREVDPIEIVWTLILGVPLVILFALPEHRDAALALIAGVVFFDFRMAIMRRRARRRLEPLPARPATVSLRETAYLPFPSAAVWAVLHAADSALLINPDIVKGYRVPGTPDGVGEQQAFIDTAGNTTVIEVIEYSPGQRAITRQISPKPPIDTLSTWAVQSDGGWLHRFLPAGHNGVTVTATGCRRTEPLARRRTRYAAKGSANAA